jgi:hypothetical protein
VRRRLASRSRDHHNAIAGGMQLAAAGIFPAWRSPEEQAAVSAPG